MTRYLCIHGHFYQPPRENPWLEAIEQQDSAYPFHDWNERIAAECYRPNGAARILDEDRRISRIVNNYTHTSFNFGPTLLSWLERCDAETYRTILAADASSRERFSGHGAALAQAYNHIILPLANRRDKRTQVRWGIADFVHRFGRPPEGLWLPETAVDLESLEELAEAGIAFTILAPHQASQVRKIGASDWLKIEGAAVDTKQPYRCNLPSGRSIALFFYDGVIANEVAFRNLLEDGEAFATRLTGGFTENGGPALVHVATDGETYGHHHRFGEMALAYALDKIESRGQARLTIYAEFLEKFPPTHEVEIREDTSWSCAHGVDRWRADCGCHSGGQAGWTQAWRGPLREALDWLRDTLEPLFETHLAPLCPDPWGARNAYIQVILDRTPERIRAFMREQAGRDLVPEEAIKTLRLLELQRHALLMYTSCGWFFDEVSGIETTQILAYAGRAIQLAEEVCDVSLEEAFRSRLEGAKSNLSRWGNASRVYVEKVQRSRIYLDRVAAHHAIVASLDPVCPDENSHRHDIGCYAAEDCKIDRFPSGRMQLTVGHARIRSKITWNEQEFSFAVLNFGGHNITAGVGPYQHREDFTGLRQALREDFEKSDLPAVIRQMDRHFGSRTYNLWHLFKDEQRRVVQQLMAQTLAEIEESFGSIYANHFPLMRFLNEIGVPIPKPLAIPVELVLIGQVRHLLETGQSRPNQLQSLAAEIEKLDITLDEPMLGLAAGRQLVKQMEKLARTPQNLALMLTVIETLEVLKNLPIHPDLWRAQNLYWKIHREESGQPEGEWRDAFQRLGDCLQMRIV